MSYTEKYQKQSPYIVFFGMLLIVVSLFFSRFLLSIGFIIIITNSILEGNYKKKIQYIKQNNAAFLIVLLLIFHLIGLIYTQNISKGLNDIRLKSFILLVLFYGLGTHLSLKRMQTVFKFYVLSAFLASLISIYRFYFISTPAGIEDLRGIAFLGDNLYQAIFINFAIVLAGYFLINTQNKLPYILAILLFVFYLFLLNSLTGYVLLFGFIIYNSIFILFKIKNIQQKKYILIFSGSMIFISIIYVSSSIYAFYQKDKIDYHKLPAKTVNDNFYTHDTINQQFENGHYLFLYLCEKELRQEWNVRSNIPFDNQDRKNQQIKYTLIRYLSSKNLSKDSVGIWKLNNKDIENIENGYANYLYADNFSMKGRIYLIIWQLDKYFNDHYADRQTISQRAVYMKIAWKIIKDNIWIGVGSGDVQELTKLYFKKTKSGLSPGYENTVHNQFMYEFVALGIWGGIGFIFIFFYPYFKLKLWNDYLFNAFFLIITLSFFAEFLFETQLGVSFFSVFYALLIFKEEKTIQ